MKGEYMIYLHRGLDKYVSKCSGRNFKNHWSGELCSVRAKFQETGMMHIEITNTSFSSAGYSNSYSYPLPPQARYVTTNILCTTVCSQCVSWDLSRNWNNSNCFQVIWAGLPTCNTMVYCIGLLHLWCYSAGIRQTRISSEGTGAQVVFAWAWGPKESLQRKKVLMTWHPVLQDVFQAIDFWSYSKNLYVIIQL